jgi:hypothetical protein
MQVKLWWFIKQLNSEVISVFPNVIPIFIIFSGIAKVEFLLIVEKIK